MAITCNRDSHAVAGPLALEMLLDANGFGGNREVVEINRQIIPRSRYGAHAFESSERNEIVHSMAGG